MTIRTILILAVTLSSWCNLFATQIIPVSIAHLSPAPEGQSIEKVEVALNYFFDLVRDQCQIDVGYRIESLTSWDLPFKRFQFDAFSQQYKISETQQSDFQYFQYDLWRILKASPYAIPTDGIKLISVPNLDGYCGFAFPKIQFASANDYLPNAQVEKMLTNSILINYQQASCGSYNRIVAHELAHLFIQDNPAHYCPNSSGGLSPCPEDNLLSVFRTVRPTSMSHKKPGQAGLFSPDGGDPFNSGKPGGFNDPMVPQKLPSIGTTLLPEQCRAIEKTVQEIVSYQ